MEESEVEKSIAIGEIEQGPSKFDQFLDRNQKNLLFILIALIVLVAGFLVMKGLGENKREEAAASLMGAKDAAGYQDVSKSYAGTPAGGTAMLAAANSQWESDDKDAAISTLKSFLSEYPDHPSYASVLVNLGSKLINKGDYAAARGYLSEARDLEDSTYSPFASILSADAHLLEGNKDEAVQALEAVKGSLSHYTEEEYMQLVNAGVSPNPQRLADTQVHDLIKQRLIAMNAPLPPEVAPEPKPESPAPAPTIAPGALPPGIQISPSGPESAPASTPDNEPAAPAPTENSDDPAPAPQTPEKN